MQEFQNAGYGTGGQLAPQGFFGGLLGAPLGGAIGKGIGGLFGNAGLGNQIGQIAGGIGGTLLPFGTDPVTAAYAQQAQQQQLMQQLQQQQQQPGQQLAPQGWFGNLLGQVGHPLGGAIGGLFGQQGAGSTIGGVAGQLGKLLPFGADPVSAAYAQQMQQAQQQQQLAPQGWFGNLIGQVGQPLGGAIGGLFGQQGVGSTIGNVAGQLGKLLPFGADPVSAAYVQQLQQAQQQQQQLAPQGWFGNLIGQVGQPLGGAIGGLFGQQGAGSAVGNVAGQLGKLLPFGAEPQAFANVQQQMQQQIQQLQQQLIQQQQQHQQQLQQLMAQQQQAQQGQQGQQGQFAPQGWFGNLLGQVGRPLGGAIGSVFGNAGLGSTIGGAAGQIGQMLPFGMDPITAAYAQQAQLAQQQGMPQYSSQQTLH